MSAELRRRKAEGRRRLEDTSAKLRRRHLCSASRAARALQRLYPLRLEILRPEWFRAIPSKRLPRQRPAGPAPCRLPRRSCFERSVFSRLFLSRTRRAPPERNLYLSERFGLSGSSSSEGEFPSSPIVKFYGRARPAPKTNPAKNELGPIGVGCRFPSYFAWKLEAVLLVLAASVMRCFQIKGQPFFSRPERHKTGRH